MTPALRPAQAALIADTRAAWAGGARNVMAVAPTGFGKTVVLAAIVAAESSPVYVIAHRQELVSQISMSLARNGVKHNIFGTNATLRRNVAALQMAEFGRIFISDRATVTVAGVDSLVRQAHCAEFERVGLVVQDEAHHVLRSNKWGKVAELFPNARGFYPTATPARADRYGLGRDASGIMDAMVQAPSMRATIDAGYLTKYRVAVDPARLLDRSKIDVSAATGDFKQSSAARAVKESVIFGRVVESYLKFAAGRRGVTFCVDVEAAEEQARLFNAAGVPAAVLHAKSTDTERYRAIQKLKSGDLLQITNVDLFGEGFDLPAIEVVSMARPTASLPLYIQQAGRALRLMLAREEAAAHASAASDAERLQIIAESAKPVALIIDHVGNYHEHGPPDAPREWSLDGRTRAKRATIAVTECLKCWTAYERVYRACPACGAERAPPTVRARPEEVDGDLVLLDPDALAVIHADIARVDGPARVPHGVAGYVQQAVRKRHDERAAAQAALRRSMAVWAGWRRSCGDSQDILDRRFFADWGIDAASAQALGAGDAASLAGRIDTALAQICVVSVDSAQ